MSRKKILLMAFLVLTVLLSVVLGVIWNMRNYVLVDLQFYPRGARQLDLRDREFSARHYENLQKRLPDCEILWNVPFQDASIPSDAEEVTVSSLNDRDIRALQYFIRLKRVNAENCKDYESLQELQKQWPDLQVTYHVQLGTESHPGETELLTLQDVSSEAIDRLQYLPKLKQVLCSGGEADAVARLKDYCQNRGLEFRISLGGEVIPLDVESVTVEEITEEAIGLLQLLPELKQLHLLRPKASVESLQKLQKDLPGLALTWEQDVCGQLIPSGVEEIDLSGSEVTDLELLDRQLSYFPEAKVVFLGECGLDNETLAVHRDQVRSRYKLVWTVSFGNKLKARTDATTFMPVREYVYYFNDEEAYNLRYCEDMVCIDIGHMSIHNIDFVQYMPNLRYLILAHTQLQDISPISTCKKLKFLELDWSPVRDLTPLQGCTALEDLNLGNVHTDFTPVGEMSWLKNLWMIDCSTKARYEMTQALPDTKVMVTGAATVANGWRNLENYYEMRDLLGMHYMSW